MRFYAERILSALGLCLFAAACGETNDFISKKASQFENFSVDGYVVGIQKSSLEKEFLLQGSLVPQPIVPMPTGLKSRIVIFKERGDQLAMVESTKGQAMTADLPMTNVIATFPILKKENDFVYFDFAKGMSALMVAYDWYASDFYGSQFNPQYRTLSVNTSYLDSVSFTADNNLVVRQIAQLQDMSVEVKYYLSPYRAHPQYSPTKWSDFDRMAFFEINPQLVNQKSVTYVTKRDATKPVTYAVSANTPLEYRQAVKDAVLYWNNAFEADVVRVIDAPEGVTAPDADYNLIQWVNWDGAGFAYADAQMDPLTGEILHSQIIMTSAFGFHAQESAKKILERFKVTESDKKKMRNPEDLKNLRRFKAEKKTGISLSGFQTQAFCFRDETERLRQIFSQLVSMGANDAEILKISQDYVREVVAHEVGHTLGLRHNFAGSLAMNYKLSERTNIFNRYLQTGAADRAIRTTSSVMEYQEFEEAVMSGSQIQQGGIAYDYDKKAIQSLYQNKKFADSEIPLFCTDSHLGVYEDCIPFDIGRSAMEEGQFRFQKNLEDLPYLIVDLMEQIKDFSKSERISFEDLWLTPDGLAMFLNNPKIFSLVGLIDEGRYLRVERSYSSITQWNLEEVKTRTSAFKNDQLRALGGLKSVFADVPADYARMSRQKIEDLIERKNFTKDEQARIRRITKSWFDKLESSSVADDLLIAYLLTKMSNPIESKTSFYFDKADRYILKKSTLPPLQFKDVKLSTKSSKKVTLNLPQYAYDGESRTVALLIATSLGGSDLVSAVSLSLQPYKESLRLKLEADLKSVIGDVKPQYLDYLAMPAEVRDWVGVNLDLLTNLKTK